jgi:hypothetical protein
MSYDGPPAKARRLPALFTILGAIVFALAACSSGATSSGTPVTATATGTPATTPAASPAPPASTAPTGPTGPTQIAFPRQNASPVFGGGLLNDLGNGSTAIALGIVAVGYTDPLTAEIVSGACSAISVGPGASMSPDVSAAPSAAAASSEPSAPAASAAPTPATLPIWLTPVSGGASRSIVQMSLADLLGSPTSIVVHHSAADPSPVACADITTSQAAPAAPGPSSIAPAPSAAPKAAPKAQPSMSSYSY